MEYLDYSAPTPQANLACDEALLDSCEARESGEVLRFWESPEYFVVIGYGNQASSEANLDACRAAGVPVLRRCSGGGTVLQGPGCLNYAVVLDQELRPELASITATNCYVMKLQRDALRTLDLDVQISGHTDLVLNSARKFSGNSQRRRKRAVLFHGTLLYDFEIPRLEDLLRFPSIAPEYRHNRTHSDFVTNLPLSAEILKRTLRSAWSADVPFERAIDHRVEALINNQYGRPDWSERR